MKVSHGFNDSPAKDVQAEINTFFFPFAGGLYYSLLLKWQFGQGI